MEGRKKYLSGVTLVEVLVAVLILGLGIVSAANCMNAAYLTNKKAENIAVATAMAVSRLEEVRQNGYVKTLGNPATVGVIPLTATSQAVPVGWTLSVVSSYYNDNTFYSGSYTHLRTNMILQVVATVTFPGTKNSTNTISLTTYMSDRDKL